ncbi:alpha/beta fold hydrolase [Streptomyces monticola]|uniref:Alpha/beta fold hydrolase n=1 Tax=Streptomyces monticola TaxID=2666263 RepID=A0ABW2JNE4_9ACTN
MPAELVPVAHRTLDVDGVRTFYREAGPPDAPVVLLPHGYPSSSFMYRNLLPVLGDRWRLLAPDFPGFGYSETPDPAHYRYAFAAYADFLESFVRTLGVGRFALYLFDYGSQAGLQLATRHPEWITAVVIQNGDAYEATLGPKYDHLKEFWSDPSPERRAALAEAVTERGLREEVIGEVPAPYAERISPDLWELSAPRLCRSPNREIMVDLFADIRSSVDRFPAYQSYLRGARPAALIVWGPHDGYMPEESARAYLADLPDAELHLLDGAGHWALETHLHEVTGLMREFLGREHP